MNHLLPFTNSLVFSKTNHLLEEVGTHWVCLQKYDKIYENWLHKNMFSSSYHPNQINIQYENYNSTHCISEKTRNRGNNSTLDQRCFKAVDQGWNNVDPTLKIKQNPTSDFQRLIQRRCPTLKQRWYNFISTLLQRGLNIGKIFIETNRASDNR